jgi:hypothetical protein
MTDVRGVKKNIGNGAKSETFAQRGKTLQNRL